MKYIRKEIIKNVDPIAEQDFQVSGNLNVTGNYLQNGSAFTIVPREINVADNTAPALRIVQTGSSDALVVEKTAAGANSPTERMRISSNGNTTVTGNIAICNPNLVDTNGTARSISGPLGSSDVYTSHSTLLAAENSKSVLELYTYYGMEYGKISFGNVGVFGSWNPVEQATISSFNNGGGDGGILEFKTKAISGSLTQRILITESGEVRIGSGYLNTDKLQVGGNIAFTGGLNLMSGSNTVQWNIARDTNNNLIFSHQGVDKMKLDTSGNLTVVGDVTAFGTI